ncbi:MAG: hypothetical protein LBM93_06530 [Oscillospiraceae bacterium]|jgi:hypothetical protein|nr:hypothetical protein [Oscillospiraceae bacterium]
MKTIYWVDDNISQLKIVAERVFCDLWQNSINNKIILIGDDYKNTETSPTISQKHIDALEMAISDSFIFDCNNRADEKNSPMDIKKEREKNGVDVTNKNVFWLEEAPEVVKAIKKLKNVNAHKQNSETDLIISKIKEIIKGNEKACVVVDCRLIFGDRENIKNSNTTLSMVIFNALSREENLKLLMYSSYVLNDNISKDWCKVYNKVYPGSVDEIFKVFDRKRLTSAVATKEKIEFIGEVIDFFNDRL